MAATEGSGCSSKIICFYESRVFVPENPIAAAAAAAPRAPSSSSSVVFKVQCFLRFSVQGHPMTEFLEEKNWRQPRQSSIELPWSRDGIIIDDDNNNLKISETLTLLRVPKVSHQSIIDKLSPLGLAPMIVVEIFEVTHATLPVINEEGKKIIEEYEEDEEIVDQDEIDDQDEVVPVPDYDEKKQELLDADCFNSLKKLILDVTYNHEEEVAIIDWITKFIAAAYRVASRVTGEEGDKEAKEEEKERTCPICMEIFEPNETWSEMLCCPQVFHCDCISMWTKRGKTCPWCRSSLPLIVQSAKGFIHRDESDYFCTPIHPGFCTDLVVMWYLLGEWAIWSKERLHPTGCGCGCNTRVPETIVA